MEKKHKLTRGCQQFSTWNFNNPYLHLQIAPQFFSDAYCIALRASQEVLFEGPGVHLRMQRSLPWCKISKGPHDLMGRFFVIGSLCACEDVSVEFLLTVLLMISP